jgi:hypothetical protein
MQDQPLEHQPLDHCVDMVAASTVAAAHRRDHRHDRPVEECHPHRVEVVHLGHRAVAVCHCCQADSGFMPVREAEHLARGHAEQTSGRGSVPLVAAVA